ncbi:hypothetical protein [Parasitella parasitica]|uniref:Pentacotripeptide-repeat region of PRORP domain-containing protein n=1 Tax=Parasitella parasitica TaxID=35722 RepID=A0A0B7NU29_9FUNG|nr:hypothetical protein [Parasitella parasitica]
MVFRSCLCSRKYQPLNLYKLQPFFGSFKYPGILLNHPPRPPAYQRLATTSNSITSPNTTSTHQIGKKAPFSDQVCEIQRELNLVLSKKYTTKQSKAYYRRLSKQSPEQLADIFASTANTKGSRKNIVRVAVEAAAYWPQSTIQSVFKIWDNQFAYLQFGIFNSILLKKYTIDRDIAPIIDTLPMYGRPYVVMPFYNAALNACRENRQGDHLRLIINIMKERNIRLDTASFNILLQMKLKQEWPQIPALKIYQDLLEQGAVPNHATFNTFIKHAVQHKEWYTLENWLDLMTTKNTKPTFVTLRILFRALCAHPTEHALSQAFDRVSAIAPLTKEEDFLNTGTSALLDENRNSAAMDLLQATLGLDAELSTFVYNLLLRSLCQRGDIEGAQYVLTSMIKSDSIPKPDIVSFTTVIHGLIRHSDKIDLDQINKLYSRLEKEDLRTNNVLQSVILYGLIKSKDNSNLIKTRILFNSIIRNKNIARLPVQHGDSPLSEMNIYNMMIDFYFLHCHKSKTLKNRIPKEVFELLNEAVEIKKLEPTIVTLNIMVRGLALLNKDLVAADKIVKLLQSKGVDTDETTIYYLAKSAYRQGQISKARQYINNFERPITRSGLVRLKLELNKWDQDASKYEPTSAVEQQP